MNMMWISRLSAVGLLCVAIPATGAPTAMADDTIVCEPGQVVLDGQCQVPNPAQHNTGGSGTGAGTGTATGGGAHGRGH